MCLQCLALLVKVLLKYRHLYGFNCYQRWTDQIFHECRNRRTLLLSEQPIAELNESHKIKRSGEITTAHTLVLTEAFEEVDFFHRSLFLVFGCPHCRNSFRFNQQVNFSAILKSNLKCPQGSRWELKPSSVPEPSLFCERLKGYRKFFFFFRIGLSGESGRELAVSSCSLCPKERLIFTHVKVFTQKAVIDWHSSR